MMKVRAVIATVAMVCFPVSLHAATAKIITKENALREECRFFSPVKSPVKYGYEVEILSEEGDWYRVKFNDIKGCIHKSALEENRFSLSGLLGSKTRETTSDEVALAGKGFNPQVEDSYSKKHPHLDFAAVDRVEGSSPPERELKEFIKKGGLNLP